MLKLLLSLVLAALVVGILAAVFLVDPLARTAVERGTTYATGCDSTLEGARIGLLDGDAVLTGLLVQNPEGFEGRFLELPRLEARVRTRTLLSDVVHVPLVEIEGLELALLQVGSRSNVQAVVERLRELAEAPPGEPPGEPGRRIAIDRLVVRGLTVSATLEDVQIPGADPISLDGASFTFPEIVLEDLGEPRPLGEWVAFVVELALEALIETGLPGEWRAALERHLDEAAGRLLDEARERFEEVREQGRELLEGQIPDLGGEGERIRRDLEDVLRRGGDG